MDKYDLLKRIQAVDPQALVDAHDELIGGYDKNGQPIGLGDPVFEMDGEMHRVPFQQLRDVLQGREPQSPKQAQAVFAGRIPKSVVRDAMVNPARQESGAVPSTNQHDSDDSYYWDKNYNYEYMNPEAEKQKVLGKIRK